MLNCLYCDEVFQFMGNLKLHVKLHHRNEVALISTLAAKRIQENKTMGKSIGDMKKERGVGGPPMLHGSDVPKGVSQFKIKVKELREAPAKFNSMAIIDLAEPAYGAESFAVNITNMRALATLHGLDPEEADFDILAKKVAGKTLTLYVSLTNNPKSKKMVRSLFFSTEGAGQ